jgi:hypothetical protein
VEAKVVREVESSHSQVMEQERNTLVLAQNQEAFKEFMNTCKVEQRYLIEVINQLKREVATEREEKEELKEQIR